MPPPQRFLAPRIQGFVCRSCLSKLRSPRTQRPPWLSRSVASDDAPRRSKPPKAKKDTDDQLQKESQPVIRVWDETPDGVRIERGTDPGDAALLETMESTIQEVREEMAAESQAEDIDEDELQERVVERHMQQTVQEGGIEDEIFEEMGSLLDKLDEEVDKELEEMDFENMSEEQQLRVQDDVFARLSKENTKNPSAQLFSPSRPKEPETPLADHEFPSDIEEQLPIFVDALRSASTLLERECLNRPASVEIWNAYNLCRENFISHPDKVPADMWESLWNIFTDKKTVNYGFLKILGQDMIDVGVPMHNWQRFAHIQATFYAGNSDDALKLWEDSDTTLGSDSDIFKEYWQLGRDIYTRQDQLDKALRAVGTLIESTKDTNYFRGILPIMQALLFSKEDGSIQKVWALYIRLKTGLGHLMSMEDYDNVASMCFAANQPNMALGVFRDMMLGGDATAVRDDSKAPHGIGKSHSNLLKIDKNELTWDDPRVLAKLPANFNNKFFFGKWLKKLIGDGEYDASVKVFNLMHERGIETDARYMNGLIGAWLRTGKPEYHKLAEDASWRMIEKRLQYVEDRDTRAVLSSNLRPILGTNKPDHKSIWHYPRATVETFAILIQDYRRRQRHDLLKDLMKALELARIQPNSYLLNQIMMMQSSIRPTYHAWDTYASLTRTQGVQPDFDTFGYLWHLTKRAVDPNLNPAQYPKVVEDVQNLAVPRLLVAEMAIWTQQLKRRNELPRELYDMIILSFSLAQDHAGTAITLRFLQRHFHMFPDEDTVRTIVLQLARAGLENEDHHRRRRLNVRKSPVIKDRVVQVTRLLEGFKERREAELLQQGIVFDELSGDERLEESLILMTNLLRHVTKIRMGESQHVAEIFENAGKAMGVPDCVPPAPLEQIGSG